MKGFDYSFPGAYFVTVVTRQRKYLFGEVVNDEMQENQYGKIVRQTWIDLTSHYLLVSLDAFVIMPNHVHGILVINDSRDESPYNVEPMPSRSIVWGEIVSDAYITNPDESDGIMMPNCRGGSSTHPYKMIHHGLPEFVRAFKSFSARRINQLRNMPGVAIWQRSFYDRIIRNEWEFHNIRDYIQTNPQRWQEDKYN
jgi:putative transposase